jgi:hypothetical protein
MARRPLEQRFNFPRALKTAVVAGNSPSLDFGQGRQKHAHYSFIFGSTHRATRLAIGWPI